VGNLFAPAAIFNEDMSKAVRYIPGH